MGYVQELRSRGKKKRGSEGGGGWFLYLLASTLLDMANQPMFLFGLMGVWGGHEEVEEHCSSCLDGCALNKAQGAKGRVQAD